MGYLISAHFVKRRPDPGRLRAALPKSIAFVVYKHSVHPVFAVDTYRATKPVPYPFSAATPATDIPLDIPGPLAAVYEQLRLENAANGLKRSYINLCRILSGALNEEVLSVFSDDDGNDFACLARNGEVVSGIAACERYLVTFDSSNASQTPLLPQSRLHSVASEAVTSWLGMPASSLGFGSFDPPENLGFELVADA